MPAIAPETIDLLTLPSLPISQTRQLPSIPAVYLVLSNTDSKVLYVGKSANIKKRWQTHHLLVYLKLAMTETVKIAWLEIDKTKSLNLTEKRLIGYFKPELNIKSIGFELPKKRKRAKNDSSETKYHFDTQGNFKSPNPEPMAKRIIGVRLPVSVDLEVREVAGEALAEWVRQAIAEKLARDRQPTKQQAS